MKTHEGLVAVVTGAARGIGQEIAIAFARAGCSVVALDRLDCAETLQAVSAAGADSVGLRTDVGVPEDWQNVRENISIRFGRCDILINNAGIFPFAHLDDLNFDIWNDVIRINLSSQYLAAKHLAPLMAEHGWGRIISLASNSVATNAAGMSHYFASKMGVIGLTRGLANDLGGRGITVNAVAPSLTPTPGTGGVPEEFFEQIAGLQSIKRQAKTGDYVGPILFLASREAEFITGQTIVVDGGLWKN
ncbi:UNVERIFIED_ORG: 3-oxoacyl-[acyl-carrier protein] reductase [Xanthobacter viscosus]|uniref:SDR family oxidoreductase n=1 Tax=Xanthobacter autotrophicus TaxID=280 RepID=A0A6C1KAT4_XANAU|nr:SDR family NAD(P)-dependent oxidoreductase [Xanthobacter autotrophicus]TLX41378.1 SDR family oxidoreductase [Xanthobacter autotrophicus]